MKKLFQHAEKVLGVDLDGDGHVGKPGAGRGYSQPAAHQQHHQHQPQQQHYQQPPPQAYQQQAPVGGGAPGSGNRKALLIGINYYGQQGQLSGCINDVKTMQQVLRRVGYAQGSYQEVILCDDRSFPGAKSPTKQEIINAMTWLASNNRPGDTLFFHYSGHGGQVKDLDGDEGDGFDETLIPVDFRKAGQITDDVIFDILVARLPAGVRMTAVMDCCHSGTAMDLPFSFKATQQGLALDPSKMAMSYFTGGKKKKQELMMQMLGAVGGGGGGLGALLGGGKPKEDKKKHSHADVVMFSGCSDSQTSADVGNVGQFNLPSGAGPGGAGGACTNALASILLKTQGLTFVQLLDGMRQDLKRKGFKQVPQLSSSKPVDLSGKFSFFGPLQPSRIAPVQNQYNPHHQPPPHGQYPPQHAPGHHAPPAHGAPQAYAAPSNPYAQAGPPPGVNPYAASTNPYAGQQPGGAPPPGSNPYV